MNIVTKDPNLHLEVLDMAKSLYDFMKTKFHFTCEPSIHFISDAENAKKVLGKTGYYDPKEESVHVYVTNRHPKDILRSLAHELLHHIQGCEGMVKSDRGDTEGTKDPNYVLHDKFLKQVEADAFERGNIAFREWEAHVKQGDIHVSQEKINEAQKKMTPKQKEKRHNIMGSLETPAAQEKLKKQYPGQDPMAMAGKIATTQAMKKGKAKEESTEEEGWKEESLAESKEVQVNDALKNSLYYVKEDRAANVAYEARDEKVYNELLRKFKIKK